MIDPFCIAFGKPTKVSVPSFSADKIIPSDNSPRNLTGFKFVTTATFYQQYLQVYKIQLYLKQFVSFRYLNLLLFSKVYLIFNIVCTCNSSSFDFYFIKLINCDFWFRGRYFFLSSFSFFFR